MDNHQVKAAIACLEGEGKEKMTFSEISKILLGAGFSGYTIDIVRARIIYTLNTGEIIERPIRITDTYAISTFDVAALKKSISKIQHPNQNYNYAKLCADLLISGCANCVVSFSGRQIRCVSRFSDVYIGNFTQY